MPKYSLSNTQAGSQQNLSTSYKTINYAAAATGATTLRRVWIYEMEFGADGAPNASDTTIVWSMDRTTAAGTATSATPSPLEINDAAALATYQVNATAEPTVTVNLGAYALNQRNSQRILFQDLSSALVVPAVNAAGIVMRAKSAIFASTVVATWYVQE